MCVRHHPRSTSSRKRPRNRVVVVVVASSVAVLSLLPILSAPASPATTAATPQFYSDGPHGSGFSPPEFREEDSPWGQQQEQEEEEEEDPGSEGGGGEGGGRTLNRAQAGGGGGVVSHEGRGGELADGRDRCFIDSEGSQRCYPTVFFFGTSKCGKLFFRVGSFVIGLSGWWWWVLLPAHGCHRWGFPITALYGVVFGPHLRDSSEMHAAAAASAAAAALS